MIDLRIPSTSELAEVEQFTKNFIERANGRQVFCFYENGRCVGGASVSNDGTSDFRFFIASKDSVGICRVLWQVFKEILPAHPVLTSKILRSNTKSIKGTLQYGAKVAFKNDKELTLVFSKEMWKYQKRYPL